MQGQGVQKSMYATNRKQKLFNVRKVLTKNIDGEKILLTPQQSKLKKQQVIKTPNIINNTPNFHKNTQYNLQQSIVNSNVYKELNKIYNKMKQEHAQEKQKINETIKQKENMILKARQQNNRLLKQKQKLVHKLKSLQYHLERIRQRNYRIRYQQQQRAQNSNLINFEYLRNVLLSLRYQNQFLNEEINPDNMTYQQLLQLEQRIGQVNRGLTKQQLNKLEKEQYQGNEDQLCPICYYQIKKKQLINKFSCGHIFHCDCIKEWLEKQKKCPICKKQIIIQ